MAYKFQADLGWLKVEGETDIAQDLIAVTSALENISQSDDRDTIAQAAESIFSESWAWDVLTDALSEKMGSMMTAMLDEHVEGFKASRLKGEDFSSPAENTPDKPVPMPYVGLDKQSIDDYVASYPCPICGKVCGSAVARLGHMASEHDAEKGPKWDGVIRTDEDEQRIRDIESDALAKAKAESVLIEENPFPRHTAPDPESVTLADDILVQDMQEAMMRESKLNREIIASLNEQDNGQIDPSELVVCYDKENLPNGALNLEVPVYTPVETDCLEMVHSELAPDPVVHVPVATTTEDGKTVDEGGEELLDQMAKAASRVEVREDVDDPRQALKDEFKKVRFTCQMSNPQIAMASEDIPNGQWIVNRVSGATWPTSEEIETLKAAIVKLEKSSEQAAVFKCPECGKPFQTKQACDGHWHAAHKPRPKSVVTQPVITPVVPKPKELDRPYWVMPPQGYSPDAFKIDWNTCAQVISEAASASSWEHLVNRIADRVLSEDRAFQILLKFDHLFQAARAAKNEGGEAVRNAKIEAQKELISIAKEGKVAFG